MKIKNEFTVSAPIDRTWNTMLDLGKIASCLPGAAIQEETGQGEYAGTIKVRVGPISASYKGTVRFEEADEANHRAVLRATGRDARGQGTASATIVSTLREEGPNTKVDVETDLQLTGRAAQFGSGIAQDVATRMLEQFAACLEQEISGSQLASENAAATGATMNGKATTAGATGAVVAGSGPTEAAASAPTTRQPNLQVTPRREPPEEPEAFDLVAASQDETLKRLTPMLAVTSVLLVFLWLFRRKR